MTEQTELLPCPECKSPAHIQGVHYNMYHRVECDRCERRTGSHFDEAAAIAAWNRRAAPVTGWVSVDERLPEPDYSNKSTWVWVYFDGKVEAAYYRYSRGEWETETYGVNPDPNVVTHWMPITPPGSDDPAPDDERRALGNELIAFCADLDNVEYYDDNGDPFCAFCGDVQANGVEHLPDCLHLRARQLQERGDES